MKNTLYILLCALSIVFTLSCSIRLQNILTQSTWSSQEYDEIMFDNDTIVANFTANCTITPVSEEMVDIKNCSRDIIDEGEFIIITDFPGQIGLLPPPELHSEREPIVLEYVDDDELHSLYEESNKEANRSTEDESAISLLNGPWRVNKNRVVEIVDTEFTMVVVDGCRVWYASGNEIELSNCLYGHLTDSVYTVTEESDGSIILSPDTSDTASPIILQKTAVDA